MKDCDKSVAHMTGIVTGVSISVLALIITLWILDTQDRAKLSCRKGKLYEVTYDGNITIYDPTYNDCEEK